jgi:hypothetical protein
VLPLRPLRLTVLLLRPLLLLLLLLRPLLLLLLLLTVLLLQPLLLLLLRPLAVGRRRRTIGRWLCSRSCKCYCTATCPLSRHSK